MKEQTPIPRAHFCWECGKFLRQRKIYVEHFFEGHNRIFHKQCLEQIMKGDRTPFSSKAELLEEMDEQIKKDKV